MAFFKKKGHKSGTMKFGPITITTGEEDETSVDQEECTIPDSPAVDVFNEVIPEQIEPVQEIKTIDDVVTKIMETGIEIMNEETKDGEFSTEGRCKILIEIAVDDNKIFKGKTVYLSEDWTQLFVQYTEAKDGKELAALIEGKIQTTYLLTGNIVKTKEDILAGR